MITRLLGAEKVLLRIARKMKRQGPFVEYIWRAGFLCRMQEVPVVRGTRSSQIGMVVTPLVATAPPLPADLAPGVPPTAPVHEQTHLELVDPPIATAAAHPADQAGAGAATLAEAPGSTTDTIDVAEPSILGLTVGAGPASTRPPPPPACPLPRRSG